MEKFKETSTRHTAYEGLQLERVMTQMDGLVFYHPATKTTHMIHPTLLNSRIVALGNFDPHDWSKNDCFAPVLTLPLRTQIILSYGHQTLENRKELQLQTGILLPDDEKYP